MTSKPSGPPLPTHCALLRMVEDDFYLSSFIGDAPNGTPTFARFNANPNFAPEQLNAYEVGYRQLIGKNLYLDVAGFFNHYHDLFSEDITGGFSIQSTLPYPAPAPPPTYLLLPAQFQNDLYGATTAVKSPRMAADEISGGCAAPTHFCAYL